MYQSTNNRTRFGAVLFAMLLIPRMTAAQEFRLRIETADAVRRNSPVTATLPAELAAHLPDALVSTGGWLEGRLGDERVVYPAQFERTDESTILWFVLRRAEAGETLELTFRPDPEVGRRQAAPRFHFADHEGRHLDYRLDERGVLRHMYGRDEGRNEETYKVYTHIYGYHDEPFITKGPGGTYPHHRGMFVGWNRTFIDGKRYDFWHMRPVGTIQKHIRFEPNELAGPVVGRQTDRIQWLTPDGRNVIEERRTIAALWQPQAQSLFDVEIELRSRAGRIRLEGDPQHAGFQVRAVQAVYDHQRDTEYFVPEDSTYQKNVKATGSWVTCAFTLQGHPYAVLYFSHPSNPHRDVTVMSTRQYGRFGEYFPTVLDEGQPLRLRYRVIVMDLNRHGAMSASRAQAKYDDYVTPVKVTFLH